MDSANAASAASPKRASPLLQRVLSSLVLLPVLAALIWLGFWPTALLALVAAAFGLYELYSALAHGGYRPRWAPGFAAGLLLCATPALARLTGANLAGFSLALALGLTLVAELARRDREGALTSWALTFAGACYVGWLLAHYLLLRALATPLVAGGGWLAALRIEPGAAWVYAVLAITWLQDTGAYFVGRAYGRHKMAPYLSPKKSWEGAAGGVLASLLTALLLVALLGLPISYAGAALLGLVGALAGLLGDLAESFIKRQVHVKDAGALIPGHGGLLDRADSLLFTGPALYYLILLLT
jgi:phosphatidate cytidylyltransferase